MLLHGLKLCFLDCLLKRGFDCVETALPMQLALLSCPGVFGSFSGSTQVPSTLKSSRMIHCNTDDKACQTIATALVLQQPQLTNLLVTLATGEVII